MALAFWAFARADGNIGTATIGFVLLLSGAACNFWVRFTWKKPPVVTRILVVLLSAGSLHGIRTRGE